MVQFTRLRLSGFKSFVEPTEFEIGKGLTGIVGPNGCGKSNLVEALRWVMGENSPKRMRSSGMDDVIFNGTERRPQRNSAEVVLALDNSDRTAPAELNDSDELEVSRRIEREEGSNYKVNGKNVRMRDVQLLFADSSIGAHSPAMVSQGRVSDMINAKPAQRRMVLEEAAGVSGLHARRHEAELKLRAAETNLTRVEDVVGAMAGQLEALKKQARQASRYRTLSTSIEAAEGALLHARWTQCETAVGLALAAFDAAEEIVREKTLAAAQLATQQTETAAALPALRQGEAAAAAALQRLKLAYGGLESEERQVQEERGKAETLLAQFTADVEHESAQKSEAARKTGELEAENIALAAAEGSHRQREEDAAIAAAAQREAVAVAENALSALTSEIAGIEAARNAEDRRIRESETSVARAAERRTQLDRARADIAAALPPPETTEAAAAETAGAEAAQAQAAAAFDAAEALRPEAETAVQSGAERLLAAERAFGQLDAEAAALRRLLENPQGGFPAVLDSVSVEAGLEKALAAALGDGLEAALDPAAPAHWTSLPALGENVPLPGNLPALSLSAQGPGELARALSQIGLAPDAETAARLMPELKPGQCLVTADGGAWRWDGLTVSAAAESPAAARLRQKNRLAEIEAALPAALAAAEAARSADAEAKTTRARISDDIAAARAALRAAEDILAQARRRHAMLESQSAQGAAKLAGIVASLESAAAEETSAAERLDSAKTALAGLPDPAEGRTRMDADRASLADARQNLADLQAAHAGLRQEGEARDRRRQQVESEAADWLVRAGRAGQRLDELAARIAQAEDVLTRLSSRPAEIEAEKQDLMTRIGAADEARKAAADLLVEAETAANDMQRALRTEESALSDAKEERARAQGRVETAQQARNAVETAIGEKFQSAPEALAARFELDPAATPAPEDLQSKFDRLLRERENMGPVNLLAEAEAAEITTKMEGMTAERDDLTAAIGKLREGIAKLNKEARERLLTAFDAVNGHFQTLFTRLFNGGSAHLKLIEADDPLEAGLEIYAQPPGKKLQALGLLSGGEQTLTSIALIFGMFLTNPAPICVLDEVDAPLDESNVDRFCTLLEDLAKGTTRFIVVTHHRMTMARMDRLYGVTMSERGVSQLVSVDLKQHELQLEAA